MVDVRYASATDHFTLQSSVQIHVHGLNHLFHRLEPLVQSPVSECTPSHPSVDRDKRQVADGGRQMADKTRIIIHNALIDNIIE